MIQLVVDPLMEFDMPTMHPESAPTADRRTRMLRLLELEHGLLMRFATAVASIYRRDAHWRAPARISRLVVDFAQEFMDDHHHAREERIVHQLLARDEPRIEAILFGLGEEREDMRFRLEGMRRALEEDRSGAATCFAWNAQAFAGKLLRHLKHEEEVLVPLLESRLDAALDGMTMKALELDQPDSLGDYAQAENVLMILEQV